MSECGLCGLTLTTVIPTADVLRRVSVCVCCGGPGFARDGQKDRSDIWKGCRHFMGARVLGDVADAWPAV